MHRTFPAKVESESWANGLTQGSVNISKMGWRWLSQSIMHGCQMDAVNVVRGKIQLQDSYDEIQKIFHKSWKAVILESYKLNFSECT